MKTSRAVAGVALGIAAVAGALSGMESPPKPPCVARQLGEPREICRRLVGTRVVVVEPLKPFSASEAAGWCQPSACTVTK